MAKEEIKANEQVSKSTGASGVQPLTVGTGAKKNDTAESKRPAPVDPAEAIKNHPNSLQVGAGFGNNPNQEQVTTGTLLVDPKDTDVHVEKTGPNTVTLAVTPGPQGYTQVLRTAEPNPAGDSRLTLVKIKYSADFKGERYFEDGKEVEMSPESAWHVINVLKIGTEVK